MLKKEFFSPEKEQAITYVDLTRHGNRFGGKSKITLDDGSVINFDDTKNLTPSGRENSKEFGKQYPEEVTLVHPRGGDESRHGQTGEDIVVGSEKFGKRETASPVLSGEKVKGSRRGEGVDYASIGFEDCIKKITEIINSELNILINERLKDISDEDKKILLDPKSEVGGEMRAKIREKAQIIGLTEVMSNDEMVKIVAENEANELMHVIELSRRGVKGGEVKAIPVVGSGMFAESLFKHALVVEDMETGEKKVGFDDINEIGGFTKQATAFRMKLMRDVAKGDAREIDDFINDTTIEYEFTDPERAELFEGKKVYLDWNKVRELAKSAKERFNNII